MRAFTIFAIATGLTASAHAQLVVTNPISDVLSEEQHLEDLAKWVQSINNQVQQINTLTRELQQTEAYVKAFGDPKQLLNIVGADELIGSLRKSSVGQTLGEMQSTANGVQALQNDARGLYEKVGQTFTTPGGVQIPRATEVYRKFAAIDEAAANFTSVYADVALQRAAVKGQIAATVRKLQSSTTDAETQKLSGVLTGYTAELSTLDKEVDQAASETVVQDIQNRADAEKQAQARREEQKAEFGEAMESYTRTFGISDTPANFPAR